MRRSAESLEITKDPALAIWSAGGTLYGSRLLSLEWRRTEAGPDELFDRVRITQRSHVLTDLPGIHALTAGRAYNHGVVVEKRIEELAQLEAGRTAADDRDGNVLLPQMAALAYQLLHMLRTTALRGAWHRGQPNRIRTWLFRLPGKLTRHARKLYLQLPRREPLRPLLLQALRRIAQLRAPPPRLAAA